MTTPPPPKPRALHPTASLRPGAWYACQHPERPPVPDVTAFDPQCPRCTIALEAAEKIAGKPLVMELRTTGGVELTTKTTTEARLTDARSRRR